MSGAHFGARLINAEAGETGPHHPMCRNTHACPLQTCLTSTPFLQHLSWVNTPSTYRQLIAGAAFLLTLLSQSRYTRIYRTHGPTWLVQKVTALVVCNSYITG